MINEKFGLLIVKAYASPTEWKCECKSDRSVVVNGGSLKSGWTISCGCMKSPTREAVRAAGRAKKKRETNHDTSNQYPNSFAKYSAVDNMQSAES